MSNDDWLSGQGQYHRRRHLLAVLILVALAAIVSEISGIVPISGAANTAVIVVMSVTLAVCVGLHMLYASYAPTRRRLPQPPPGRPIDLDTIRQRYDDFVGAYGPEQISLYVRSILEPRSLRARITEEISPQKRTIRQKVTTIVNIPDTCRKKQILFPAFVPVKGELQDDLTISVDDSSAITLTQHEYLVMTSLAFQTLMVPAPGSSLCAHDERELAELLETGLQLIVGRGRPDVAQRQEVDQCAKRIATFAPQAGRSFQVAASLLRKLADNYAIVVAITPKRRMRKRVVCYERYLIPNLQMAPARKPLRALHDRLGALLGARPTTVDITDFSLAATADSYHLFIMAPEGMYVGWQDMPALAEMRQQLNDTEALREPYVRFQRRRGQRYLHLYMRSIPKRMADRLKLDVRFYEVPPGSMAGAALAAAASFTLILIVALILSGSKVTNPNALGSDFPALVLAFPALAGAFVGFDSRSPALVGGSLSSMMSALLTVFVSLLASGLYMADGKWSGNNVHIPGITHVLGVQGLWWQSLTVLALLNVLYALYVWVSRTTSFYWLANRPGD